MNISLRLLVGCTLLGLAGCTKRHTTRTITIVQPEESSMIHHECDHCNGIDVEETEEVVVHHQTTRVSGVAHQGITESMK
jgi:hypothetical protein